MRRYVTLVEGDFVCNIPKGMTNGEVIQALFPIERIYKEEYVEVVFKGQYHTTYFTFEFWNAPYQKGGE